MIGWRGTLSAGDEAGGNRSKVIGAAVIALGLGALGAYAFASQNAPKSDNKAFEMMNGQVRTTPEGAELMPPPVAPTPERRALADTPRPRADRPSKDGSQQAAVPATASQNTPADDPATDQAAATDASQDVVRAQGQ